MPFYFASSRIFEVRKAYEI